MSLRLCLIHVSRTGSHAVQHWLCRQMASVQAHVDWCPDMGAGRSVCDYENGQLRKRHGPKRRANPRVRKGVAQLVMLENFDLRGWGTMGFAGCFDRIGIIVRDPYNWMASSWRQERRSAVRYITEPWPEDLRKFKGFPKWFGASLCHRDMWCQHVRQLLGDHDLIGQRVRGINYSKWMTCSGYRRRLAEDFGANRCTDEGLVDVPPHGGGSSWTGRKPLKLGVTLNRWRDFADCPEFVQLFTKEVKGLGRRYFDMECPW